ncbi:UNVERIFIED_CONTAM: hypothetical protein FKN15_007599 [Acipenser sinensis]
MSIGVGAVSELGPGRLHQEVPHVNRGGGGFRAWTWASASGGPSCQSGWGRFQSLDLGVCIRRSLMSIGVGAVSELGPGRLHQEVPHVNRGGGGFRAWTWASASGGPSCQSGWGRFQSLDLGVCIRRSLMSIGVGAVSELGPGRLHQEVPHVNRGGGGFRAWTWASASGGPSCQSGWGRFQSLDLGVCIRRSLMSIGVGAVSELGPGRLHQEVPHVNRGGGGFRAWTWASASGGPSCQSGWGRFQSLDLGVCIRRSLMSIGVGAVSELGPGRLHQEVPHVNRGGGGFRAWTWASASGGPSCQSGWGRFQSLDLGVCIRRSLMSIGVGAVSELGPGRLHQEVPHVNRGGGGFRAWTWASASGGPSCQSGWGRFQSLDLGVCIRRSLMSIGVGAVSELGPGRLHQEVPHVNRGGGGFRAWTWASASGGPSCQSGWGRFQSLDLGVCIRRSLMSIGVGAVSELGPGRLHQEVPHVNRGGGGFRAWTWASASGGPSCQSGWGRFQSLDLGVCIRRSLMSIGVGAVSELGPGRLHQEVPHVNRGGGGFRAWTWASASGGPSCQ